MFDETFAGRLGFCILPIDSIRLRHTIIITPTAVPHRTQYTNNQQPVKAFLAERKNKNGTVYKKNKENLTQSHQ